MATRPQSVFYSDLPYAPEITQLGDIQLVTNKASIEQSINTIMYTTPNSRIFNPTFGVGIQQYLFQEFSTAMGATIGKAIENGINMYEPRIQLNSVDVTLQPNFTYSVVIQYLVIDTQLPESTTITLTRS